jgi:hypothetical protein
MRTTITVVLFFGPLKTVGTAPALMISDVASGPRGDDFLASIRPTTALLTCVHFLKTTTSKLLGDGIDPWGCFRKTVVLKCSRGYNR